MNLGPVVNGSAFEECAGLSADGSTPYWDCGRSGGYGNHDIWQSSIIPVDDFNVDGKVDAKDMGILINHWGRNEPVCDIGSFAWGDGVVDEKDLAVLRRLRFHFGQHHSSMTRVHASCTGWQRQG